MLTRLLIFVFVLMMTVSVYTQTPTIETGVPQTLAKWRAANYSDVRYKLNLTLEKMSPTLKGTIEIRVKTDADQIILDWRKIQGKEILSTITNPFLNGKPAVIYSPSPDAGHPKVNEINQHLIFKDGVVKGENVIKLDFTSPIATSGAAVTRYVDKEDGAEYVYSLFVPSDASTAFPVFDQPDLKAQFSLIVDAPKDWKVISNTGDVIAEGNSISAWGLTFKNVGHLFNETKPISTYVFAFAAGEFVPFADTKTSKTSVESIENVFPKLPKKAAKSMVENLSNKVYVRKSQAEKFKPHAAETFRLNREAVKYLESYFDYKFPFPKYDLVLIPEFPFGGMEHAGATFLREDRIIFPTEPTKNDFVTRANLIFHEAAHQWFGDTVTMRWFDDLWLKEGFAEFMAYKTLEKVMPEYNAWKIFYERNKQAAYLTDSTKGTTPIYQEIPNLSAAKSAYGNIVYRKAPSFLRQAEFYLGEDKFQTAVRQFLKKHEFANAEWTDLVQEFETASKQDLKDWADVWVKKRGMPIVRATNKPLAQPEKSNVGADYPNDTVYLTQSDVLGEKGIWEMKTKVLIGNDVNSKTILQKFDINDSSSKNVLKSGSRIPSPKYVFPNYQDYGYGIFLLDEKSRDYVLKNIQNEKDDFLRTMMWGSLWDSVRETELAPKDYVELVIKNINVETDESTIQTLLGRVSTAMNYYLSDKQHEELTPEVEKVLLGGMLKAKTSGQKITFYRAYLNLASSEDAQRMLKKILKSDGKPIELETQAALIGKMPQLELPPLRTKDKFDIVTKLLILENKRRILGKTEAEEMLYELEKTETSDEAKRFDYEDKAGIATD